MSRQQRAAEAKSERRLIREVVFYGEVVPKVGEWRWKRNFAPKWRFTRRRGFAPQRSFSVGRRFLLKHKFRQRWSVKLPPLQMYEVLDAYEMLSKKERNRLIRIGHRIASGTTVYDGDDLFDEAIAILMAVDRKWPEDISFSDIIITIMSNVAHTEKRRRALLVSISKDGDYANGGTQPHDDPEHATEARRSLQAIYQSLEPYPICLAVVQGLAKGRTPSEIKRSLGLSNTQYASALRQRKRILQRLRLSGLPIPRLA